MKPGRTKYAGRVGKGIKVAPHKGSGTPSITQSDVYKETMQQIRYYGGVRYVLLPLYLGAMGALGSQLHKPDNMVPELLLSSTGLLLALVFGIFEWALSTNLKILWDEVTKMIGNWKVFEISSDINPVRHRECESCLRFQRVTLHVPYIVGGFYWLIILILPVVSGLYKAIFQS